MRKALIVALAIQACASHAADPTVWVFTAGRLPALQNAQQADRRFVLDHAEHALKGLSFPNPGNPAAAKQRALHILHSPRGQAAMANLQNNSEAITVAWQYGIDKLPAVLVDQQYVVYGVFDVAVAIDKVARYRDAK